MWRAARVTGSEKRRVPTSLLACLLVLLPLLAIPLAQANIECGECAWWQDALALTVIPLAVVWLVVLVTLLWRGARRLAGGAP
jgi:ABC-type Na+ efflux pump permease subunit